MGAQRKALHGRRWHRGPSAAALLVRNGGLPGDRITILEHRGTAGGSLDRFR